MESPIKKLLKKILSFIGLRISRTGAGLLAGKLECGPTEEDKYKWIQDMNIKTILDIGANVGQSALRLHEFFPNAKIYSFEPLRDCFEQMNAKCKDLPNFKSFNVAISDTKGKMELHRSEFSQSSSLSKMGKLHKEVFPYSSGETLETVDVDTLDNIAQELDLEDNILLKIDVQGAEDKVIRGAERTLSCTKVIFIETSFRELYEGQPLFAEICKLLNEHGFVYSGSWGELRNPLDGTPLQQDSIFVKL